MKVRVSRTVQAKGSGTSLQTDHQSVLRIQEGTEHTQGSEAGTGISHLRKYRQTTELEAWKQSGPRGRLSPGPTEPGKDFFTSTIEGS